MLDRDCAVCKDQFKLDTEDPDEQVVVTLPCKHPFHQPCILPWLTSSGTCPVCRYEATLFPRLHSTLIIFSPDSHSCRNPISTLLKALLRPQDLQVRTGQILQARAN